MLQTLRRKLFPAKWDDTLHEIWEAKLEVEIEEARRAAGLLKECSAELVTMANGAMHKPGKNGGGK